MFDSKVNKKILDKTIEELKTEIRKMLEEKNYSESIVRHQQVSGGEKQTIMIHDTHLEVIKGDIIQSTAELEFLTKKICHNYNKITLNLIYKATIDTDKAAVFHRKCNIANKTFYLFVKPNHMINHLIHHHYNP